MLLFLFCAHELRPELQRITRLLHMEIDEFAAIKTQERLDICAPRNASVFPEMNFENSLASDRPPYVTEVEASCQSPVTLQPRRFARACTSETEEPRCACL